MNVRFSKHAVRRISERFSDSVIRLAGIIEEGLQHEWASPLPNSRWCLNGMIGTRPVRVVITNEQCGVVTVVTAYWVA